MQMGTIPFHYSRTSNKNITIKKSRYKTSIADLRGTLASMQHLVLPVHQIKLQFIAP